MRHRPLIWLAPATFTATIALVTLGAIVRVTGAGEGCPDWPLCYGQVLPPAQPLAWIEFTHRLGAVLVSMLVLCLPLAAGFERPRDRTTLILSVLAPGVLAMQVLLGGLTVLSSLTALIVAAHLVVSLLLLATLALLTVHLHRGPLQPRKRLQKFSSLSLTLAVTLFFTLALLLLGAWVVGSGASLACMDWPLCAAAIVPFGQGGQRLLQGLHRLTAAGVIISLAALAAQLHFERRSWPVGSRLGWMALGLALVQALAGAALVLAQLPVWLRAAHVLLAALVWADLVALAGALWLRPRALFSAQESP
jgi:heme A synthase